MSVLVKVLLKFLTVTLMSYF